MPAEDGPHSPSPEGLAAPGAALIGARALHLIFLVDCSGSMTGAKIDSLNFAVRATIGPLREAATRNPDAAVVVRVLAFSTGAAWLFPGPMPVEEFHWIDLVAGGETEMGRALDMAGEALAGLHGERILPPVIVLITDGQPTDDFEEALARLETDRIGRRAVRVAIAIGEDADMELLERFIGNPAIQPLRARNPDDLVNCIRWAMVTVTASVLAPSSVLGADGQARLPPSPLPQNESSLLF